MVPLHMTLAVKLSVNTNAINQPILYKLNPEYLYFDDVPLSIFICIFKDKRNFLMIPGSVIFRNKTIKATNSTKQQF